MSPIEYVRPQGNESLFIKRARTLGIAHLCFLYEKKPKTVPDGVDGLKISAGAYKKEKSGLLIELGTTNTPSSLVYLAAEQLPKDGLHERRTGVNEVILREMAAKGQGLLYAYTDLQDRRHAIGLLGKIMQARKLARKAKVPLIISSLATSPEQLRHPKDVLALQNITE